MILNTAHIEPESYIYAPGKQFVIWVQGCSLHCKGCWNKDMWPFRPRNEIRVSDLFKQICDTDALDGLTLIGGEPFDQAEPVLELVKKAKAVPLGVTVYTGYEPDELCSPAAREIVANTDLLISGRYKEDRRNTNLKWIGSENQQISYLTDYYRKDTAADANYCEISLSETGEIYLIGFPDEELINKLADYILPIKSSG